MNQRQTETERKLLSSLVSLVRQWGSYTTDWGFAHDAGVHVPDSVIRIIFTLGARADNFSLTEMTEHLGISRAALSKALTLLRARGLVSGEAAPGDRRAVNISLTPLGKEAYQKLLHAALSQVSAVAEGYSAEELATIDRFLNGMISVIDESPVFMLPSEAN